ncbi:MAG TPA: DUF2726 domain-containing protein [bacterium]|nr:DUF2726 domain-containing protein [bacterium]
MPEEEGIGEYEIAEFQAHTSAKPYLMTYTESRFFQGLLARSEELGYLVFTKVRLADLIDIDPKYYRQQKIFYKLVSKHIDFVIADTKGRIIQCIELDDYRHEIENRNDKVKDEIMKACNIKLVRVKVNQEYDYDIILDQDTQAKNSRRINRRPFLPHGNNEIIDGSEEPEDRNQESKQGERFERQAESESSESENSRYQKAANGEK